MLSPATTAVHEQHKYKFEIHSWGGGRVPKWLYPNFRHQSKVNMLKSQICILWEEHEQQILHLAKICNGLGATKNNHSQEVYGRLVNSDERVPKYEMMEVLSKFTNKTKISGYSYKQAKTILESRKKVLQESSNKSRSCWADQCT